MIFKKLNMECAAFSLDNLPDLRQMLTENCEQKRDAGPMSDVFGSMGTAPEGSTPGTDGFSMTDSRQRSNTKKKKGSRRDQSCVIRDLVTALAVCHNVTPTFPNPDNKKIVEYQASSPDEVALVKFAESLEMRLMDRDQHQIVIESAAGDMETYEVLANFPFSSDTKRMGIIVRHKGTGRLMFYLKGAETVMKNKVRPN
mmetsp:Transcript_11257/g.17053  ORF Transcript_11257/g.17053 Transcript_11257/m.17053 type:complete len:199 (-) Transcript_11257:1451-2047(-)